MNGPVRLIYTEFDPDRAPFAWFGGRRLAADADRSEVYRVMATIAAAAKVVERPGTRAMRYLDKDTLLVELDLPQTDPGGAPIRLTLVLVVGDTTERQLADCAREIVAQLAGAGIPAEEGLVRDALEWGRAESAIRFPRLVAWYRRVLAKIRHSTREGEAA